MPGFNVINRNFIIARLSSLWPANKASVTNDFISHLLALLGGGQEALGNTSMSYHNNGVILGNKIFYKQIKILIDFKQQF